MKEELINSRRFKSLLWRTAMMSVAIILAVLSEWLIGLNIAGELTISLGLVLGEISKAINNAYGNPR